MVNITKSKTIPFHCVRFCVSCAVLALHDIRYDQNIFRTLNEYNYII